LRFDAIASEVRLGLKALRSRFKLVVSKPDFTMLSESEKISGHKPLYVEIGEALKLTIYGRENPNRMRG